MLRKPTINIHCHLFNLKFVHNKMVKLLTPFSEEFAKAGDGLAFKLAEKFCKILPGSAYDHAGRFINTYLSDIDKVADSYYEEISQPHLRVDICTPLMMDMEYACSGISKGDIPYHSTTTQDQISLISNIAARYAWKMFPFVFFDPRRQNALEICKDAIKNKGFIGIKMYPALGYHPSWLTVKNFGLLGLQDNVPVSDITEHASNQLKGLYEFCQNERIPITVHTGTGGAYSVQMVDNPEKNIWRLTEVSNWLDVLYGFKLKINFAHMGGNYLHGNDLHRAQAVGWRSQILGLIQTSLINSQFSEVYSDISYHDMAFEGQQKRAQYFNDLNVLLKNKYSSERILFGTDASMISHTWSELEYYNQFKKSIPSQFHANLFGENAVNFLFDNRQIPAHYIDFLVRNNPEAINNIPDWVEIKNGKFYIAE